jgi:hypothetical protein
MRFQRLTSNLAEAVYVVDQTIHGSIEVQQKVALGCLGYMRKGK